MKKYILLTIIVITLSLTVSAQQENSQGFYVQNPYSQNPAYTGSYGRPMIFTKYKQTMVGMPDAPTNYTLGAHSMISKSSAIGMIASGYTHTIFREMYGELSYAHKIKINDDFKLSLGLSLGFINHTLDLSKADANGIVDSKISGDYDYTKFTTAFGLHFEWKDLYLDMALPRMHKNETNSYFEDINAFVGYNYKTYNDRLLLQPLYGLRYYKGYHHIHEYSVTATLDEQLWVTVGGRNDRDIITGAGIFFNQFGIGYNYEYNTSNVSMAADGSHEVMLVYRFSYKKRKGQLLHFGE